MGYNEAETRYNLIDPIPRQKGYDDHSKLKLETPTPVENNGYKGGRKKGSGRTGYLLCVQVGNMPKPLLVSVLEAKKEDEDPFKGMHQAKGLFGTRHVHKKILDIYFPKYDESTGEHKLLAQFGEEAHRKTKQYLEENPPQQELTPFHLGRLRLAIKEHLKKEMKEIDRIVKGLIDK
jgi:hypothetical protein